LPHRAEHADAGLQGPGGGRTGTVLISGWVEPGSTNDSPYNHRSLLRSVEDLFGLAHLGYAGQGGLRPFGSDVYNASPAHPRAGRAGTIAAGITAASTGGTGTGTTAGTAEVQASASSQSRIGV
jgi:hypothetical protein